MSEVLRFTIHHAIIAHTVIGIMKPMNNVPSTVRITLLWLQMAYVLAIKSPEECFQLMYLGITGVTHLGNQ